MPAGAVNASATFVPDYKVTINSTYKTMTLVRSGNGQGARSINIANLVTITPATSVTEEVDSVSSSDPEIVYVSYDSHEGYNVAFSPEAPGTATVTVTLKSGATDTMTVTVENENTPITLSSGSSTISDGDTVYVVVNSEKTISYTLDSGYTINENASPSPLRYESTYVSAGFFTQGNGSFSISGVAATTGTGTPVYLDAKDDSSGETVSIMFNVVVLPNEYTGLTAGTTTTIKRYDGEDLAVYLNGNDMYMSDGGNLLLDIKLEQDKYFFTIKSSSGESFLENGKFLMFDYGIKQLNYSAKASEYRVYLTGEDINDINELNLSVRSDNKITLSTDPIAFDFSNHASAAQASASAIDGSIKLIQLDSSVNVGGLIIGHGGSYGGNSEAIAFISEQGMGGFSGVSSLKISDGDSTSIDVSVDSGSDRVILSTDQTDIFRQVTSDSIQIFTISVE
jgi:hypothetical protein